MTRWSDFIQEAPSCGHAVQIYGDPAELADSVASFLGLGLAGEAPAIVVSTRAHRDLFLARLGREGLDVDELMRAGLLTVADAEEMLATFMVDGSPSAERFEAVIGSALDAITERFPRKTVRAFGEMVDVLTRRGETQAADELEQLWNRLAETRDFALLCGYQLDVFDPSVQAGALPAVCSTHSHVKPVADPTRLAAALDRALTEVLGPFETAHVYMSVAEEMPRTSIPRGQAIMMWLAAQQPSKAGRVLSRARAHYLRRPVATAS